MQADLNQTGYGFKIVDESYDPVRTPDYQLFLYGAEDGISMAILDSRRNSFIALQEYTTGALMGVADFCLKLLPVLEDDLLLSSPGFKSVSFCYGGMKSTLVPDPLFKQDETRELLGFHFPHGDRENIYADHLKRLGARNIFAVPVPVTLLIAEKFPQASFHHHATAFTESLLQNNKNRDEKIVTVHVRLTGFELAVTRRNELLFYNSFRYQTTGDFLYFVLFVMEQLQLNPETTPFVFTGAADKNSALYIDTCKYIREVSFGERTSLCSFSYAFDELPGHFHYILFNQYLCES